MFPSIPSFPASSTQITAAHMGPVHLLSEPKHGPRVTLEQAELKLQFQLWFPWNSSASGGLLHSWSGNTPSSAPTAAKFTKNREKGFGSACQTEATA